MSEKNIVTIGAGKVGSILSKKLFKSGYTFLSVIDINKKASIKLAKEVKSKLYSNNVKDIPIETEFIMISVPDSLINEVSKQISKLSLNFNSLKVFHVSGCLTSDELKSIRSKGATVFSIHPYQTFSNSKDMSTLDSIFYGIEGDENALVYARKIVKDFKGKFIIVPKKLKILYHTAGAFVSNYLLVLLLIVEKIFSRIDKKNKEVKAIFKPILEKTIQNYFDTNFQSAITGPIIRGDAITIEKHLKELMKHDKNLYELYRNFGKILIKEARNRIKDKDTLKKLNILLSK